MSAVGGGYCRLQTPLSPALGARGTAAGHRLGALEGGGGTSPPPSNASLGGGGGAQHVDIELIATCCLSLSSGKGA